MGKNKGHTLNRLRTKVHKTWDIVGARLLFITSFPDRLCHVCNKTLIERFRTSSTSHASIKYGLREHDYAHFYMLVFSLGPLPHTSTEALPVDPAGGSSLRNFATLY